MPDCGVSKLTLSYRIVSYRILFHPILQQTERDTPLCIFADDDVAEVCDWRIERLGKRGILHRVLFAR